MITAANQQAFTDWTMTGGPRIALALVIVVVAHFAAKAVKWAIAKGIDRIPFFARRDSAGASGVKPTVDVGDRIGEVGYWLVWLLGLIAALNVLEMDAVVAPLNGMVSGFLAYLPNVVGAALIFFIGFMEEFHNSTVGVARSVAVSISKNSAGAKLNSRANTNPGKVSTMVL
jgi:hypothetical protein